ncbi:methionine ABC transporter ATP-binding protein [Gordonia soli]|uniref:Putative ABC transporter ATP-binding protein n=1 Tax=Gordonia soli NBRC 108243 TaxID=1223545 RepID=M0QIR8_9ACTN|nr:methionine ABC transporter ATP-binding protein [Gordonia soli]GAC68196.1 putative ABC transporter ATP-binding protein [Gordonia soli NBRC 108243]
MPDGSTAGTAAVEFVGIGKQFGRSGRPALDGIDLRIAPGEIVGIIGPSGAGKSTLARLINGLESPTSGHVAIDGKDQSGASEKELNKLRTGIGMIFQQFNLFNSRTVAGNVAFGLKVTGVSKADRQKRVTELLEFVGIADKADSRPAALSGGQKQRVGIARALATSPSILIADEATSALDPETTAETLRLLRRINEELGTTIVVITHEMDVIREICHSVAVLDKGTLVDRGGVYEVFSEPTSEVTSGLIKYAVAGVPERPVVVELNRRHPGRLVTIPVRDDPTPQVDITAAAARNHVSATVIHGGIAELAGRPFGALTFLLSGAEDGVAAVLDAVAGRPGVVVHEEPTDAELADGADLTEAEGAR